MRFGSVPNLNSQANSPFFLLKGLLAGTEPKPVLLACLVMCQVAFGFMI